MSGDDAKGLSDDASIGGPLVAWKARGSSIAYLGTEDIDGTEAHKLKVTLKNGDIEYVYLDPDYFLTIRTVNQMTVRGSLVKSVTDYGDYERINGVYFPFSSTTSGGGADDGSQQLTVLKASANAPMADSLFAFPAGVGSDHDQQGAT